ncbi:hypothetical protein EHP00_2121 [Ecytonucleospora hepatopenaei]|uniref:Secreted protein n=1 Tax=Ecytonucleospora hepatopenaei TaxID=646526 RepID=A0A1W0E713_9MICR|nr:hypothetical protein EHP00_2121 [Ecytonucleospora hepatopenaei]
MYNFMFLLITSFFLHKISMLLSLSLNVSSFSAKTLEFLTFIIDCKYESTSLLSTIPSFFCSSKHTLKVLVFTSDIRDKFF